MSFIITKARGRLDWCWPIREREKIFKEKVRIEKKLYFLKRNVIPSLGQYDHIRCKRWRNWKGKRKVMYHMFRKKHDEKLFKNIWRFAKENHSEIERRRRSKMNQFIDQLANLIPDCNNPSNKPDKLSILKFAATHCESKKESLQG